MLTYRQCYDIIMLKQMEHTCLQFKDDSVASGHYSGKKTAQKILRACIWWPTQYAESTKYCKNYNICQRVGKPSQRDEMELIPQTTLQVFDKWVVHFMGAINPPRKQT